MGEMLFRRAISIEGKVPNHPHLVDRIFSLGTLLSRIQRNEQALELFEKALAIREKSFPIDEHRIISNREMIGDLVSELGIKKPQSTKID
jgi:hypothetical protein